MRKLSVILTISMIGVISITLFFLVLGFRINLTNSIPVGLYRIIGTKITKNSFVIFCPDDRSAFRLAMKRGYISSGLCPSGYGYLMKKVVATQGDIVSSTVEDVFVKGLQDQYDDYLLLRTLVIYYRTLHLSLNS